ncbi:MAG: hypothetical protein V3S14_07720 [Anaerolineae bacterium]
MSNTGGASGAAQYVKLKARLVLLGYKRNRDLLEDTKNTAEGFDATGHSFLYHHLIGRGSQVKVPADDLTRYDENVRAHLAAINRRRPEPITLRTSSPKQMLGFSV